MKNVFVSLIASIFAVFPVDGSVASNQDKTNEIRGIKIESIQRNVGDRVGWMLITIKSDTALNSTWTVISDVGEWYTFVKLFSGSEIVENTGESKLVRLIVSPPWPLNDFSSLVETREVRDAHVINWKVQEGHLKGNFGTISVEEVAGGSKILYESNGPMKNAFSNWAVRIGISIVLPGVLKDFHHRIQECAAMENKGKTCETGHPNPEMAGTHAPVRSTQ